MYLEEGWKHFGMTSTVKGSFHRVTDKVLMQWVLLLAFLQNRLDF